MEPTPILRGAQRRLAYQLREAALHATADELLELERLGRLVSLEAIGVPEAIAIARGVLREQNDRRKAA